MTKEQGLILPTVLIFLMIFTLLGVSALTLSQLEMRMNHNNVSSFQELQSAEKGLSGAEQNLGNDRLISCLIPFQLKPWQSDQTCQIQTSKLIGHYVVEQLPSTDKFCISKDNLILQALYFRITAWTGKSKHPLILQSIFIKPGAQLVNKECKPVSLGRSSWREL